MWKDHVMNKRQACSGLWGAGKRGEDPYREETWILHKEKMVSLEEVRSLTLKKEAEARCA